MGRLLQLELVDFKSYSGHTLIGPFDPFTSIVGPNGSGKSNLMDALSFVLGVPSTKLRSNNLLELVHRGSAGGQHEGRQRGRRKGAAAATTPQLASVTALYQRDDGERLTFTRTINASSGNSEYILNGCATSHAEYNRILESENILVKARNFLVFQGDVEALAGKSPKELTRLLEQISGSESYREEYEQLREEHERAVESSTFAFNKRRGLSAEIKAVQEQKEDVVKFEDLLAQRQDLMTEVTLVQLKGIEENAKLLADSIDKKQGELELVEADYSQADRQYKESRKEHAKAMKELLAVEKRLKKSQQESDAGTPELVVLREKIKGLEKKIHEKLASHDKLQTERHRLAAEQSAIGAELKALEAARLAKEQELQAQLTVVPPQHQAEYRALRMEAEGRCAKDRLKLDTLERKIAPQQLQRRQIESKMAEYDLRRSQLADDLAIVDARLAEIQRSLDAVGNESALLASQLASRQTRRRKIADDEAELTDRLRHVTEQLLEQRSSAEESERQSRLRDAVESLKRIFSGVHGMFVDVTQPTARRYEDALMTVLGGQSDAVVVEHERVAIECIKYLKEQRHPPITFLPIDSLVLPTGTERLRQELPEGARLAGDLLRPSIDCPSISKAIQFVCGTTVVVDTLPLARSVIRSCPFVHRTVTLDSHVLHHSGWMTGGRINASGKSTKWEDRVARELKDQRDTIIAALQELSKEAHKLDAEERFSNSDRVDVDERQGFLEAEKVSNERKRQGIREQLEHIAEEVARKQSELQEIDASCSKTVKEIESVADKVQSMTAAVFADFTQRTGIAHIEGSSNTEIAKRMAEMRADFSSIMLKLHSQENLLRNSLLACDEECAGVRASIDEHKESLSLVRKEHDQVERSSLMLKQKTDAITAEYEQAKAKVESVSTDKASQGLADIASKRTAISKTLAMAQVQIEKLLRERDSLLRKCSVEQVYLPLLKGSLTDSSFQVTIPVLLM